MEKVQLLFDKRNKMIEHFVQPLTGFFSLHRQNIISLSCDFNADITIPIPNTFAARINGQLLFFDVSDGSDNFLRDSHIEYLREHDIILYKRAYESSLYDRIPFIHSLGLNYFGDFTSLFHRASFLFGLRMFGFHRTMGLIYNHSDMDRRWSMRARRKNKPDEGILFCTRLWEQKDCSSPVDELNSLRIKATMAIRNTFKDRAVAGVYDSALARQMCPELILPGTITKRKHYLELMNQSSVCITTTGLHRSTGWRFAEYVAAGKAIISEPLFFSPPGDLSVGKNYLTFNSADSLLASVDHLLSHPRAIRDMEKENIDYYYRFLRPDVLVFNAIKDYL
ncbi:MAG: glycosyltransferase family 1 protein [Lentisphaeria bacterium]|nr:glycosyltransferase family 1 protein [Lentisphaeria bacterium]MBR3506224.1 glycosyltransferase family 1 protein [Lentisphaeria bacterium]